jgi:hypothetical protein
VKANFLVLVLVWEMALKAEGATQRRAHLKAPVADERGRGRFGRDRNAGTAAPAPCSPLLAFAPWDWSNGRLGRAAND